MHGIYPHFIHCMRRGQFFRLQAVQYDVHHLVQNEQDSEQDVKSAIIAYCKEPKTSKEIIMHFGFANRLYFKRHFLDEMLEQGQLKMTIPEKPTSKKQKYYS